MPQATQSIVRDTRERIFWDNCVWKPLLGLSKQPLSVIDQQRKSDIELYLKQAEFTQTGIAFSPVLYADADKDVVLTKYLQQVQSLEEAGYVTILEPSSDWLGVATIRNDVRMDVADNPAAFAHITDEGKKKIGFGDAAVVYAALSVGATELWTYEAFLRSLSERRCVRGLTICEPHPLSNQGVLALFN